MLWLLCLDEVPPQDLVSPLSKENFLVDGISCVVRYLRTENMELKGIVLRIFFFGQDGSRTEVCIVYNIIIENTMNTRRSTNCSIDHVALCLSLCSTGSSCCSLDMTLIFTFTSICPWNILPRFYLENSISASFKSLFKCCLLASTVLIS